MTNSPVSQESKTSRLDVETLSKGIAFCTAIALATGFLYDAVFFYTAEARLFSLMVFADHIETAAFAVPFVLGFLLFFSLINYWMDQLERRAATLLLTALMLIFAGALYLLRRRGLSGLEREDYAVIFFIAMAGFAPIFILRPRRRPKLMELSPLVIATMFGGLWISFTTSLAFANARASISSKWSDDHTLTLTRFTLANEGVLVGRVIRLIDRGAIYTSIPGGQIEFIPKDQIRRLEMLPKNYRPLQHPTDAMFPG